MVAKDHDRYDYQPRAVLRQIQTRQTSAHKAVLNSLRSVGFPYVVGMSAAVIPAGRKPWAANSETVAKVRFRHRQGLEPASRRPDWMCP